MTIYIELKERGRGSICRTTKYQQSGAYVWFLAVAFNW